MTPMSVHVQRAIVLMQQQRHEQAEQELGRALTEEPHSAQPHALLALCLLKREQFDAATQEAQQAIGLEPDNSFSHYILSKVWQQRNRLKEAKQAIAEAIRINPDESEYYAQVAALEFASRDWQAALSAADQGLQVDPEHVDCTNLRVQALTKLGRRTDADGAIETALLRDPDNAYTHANRGWTLLEQGNPAKAMEHFREALRLNPEMGWARQGIVEALKARHFVYRWMLKYFFWMSRLSRQVQWGVLIGAALLFQFVGQIEASHPELTWITRPLVVAYLVFFVLSWLAIPLFNTVLRLSKFGRMVLTPRERWQSNLVCLFLAPALAAGVWYALAGDTKWGIYAQEIALACGFTAIFVSTAFFCAAGWPRWAMIAGIVLFAAASVKLGWMLYQAFEVGLIWDLPKNLNAAVNWRENFVRPSAAILLIAGNILVATRPRR